MGTVVTVEILCIIFVHTVYSQHLQRMDPSGFPLADYIPAIPGLLDISTNPNDVAFYLYPNPKDMNDYDEIIHLDPTSLKNSRYNISNSLIVLVHGFTQTYLSEFPYYVKKAYLDAGYAAKNNVMVVDWGKLSGQYDYSGITAGFLATIPSYIQAKSNMYLVGKRIQEYLIFLIQNGFLSGPDQIHMIGHSMGAQVCGMTGLYFQNETSTRIARITGTDPAGPLFQGYNINDRLDSTDADFVDVVHSNQGELGYYGAMGHVDFFVNGGGPIPQPACTTFANITDLFCSHRLAPRYYAKSIPTKSIKGYGSTLPILSYFFGSVIFGEHCPTSARGTYYVSLKL